MWIFNKNMKFCLTTLLLCFCSSTWCYTNEKVTVQLRWHHQFQFAGYYAAIENGFYREKGIEVELKTIDSVNSIIDEVVENRAQFSQGSIGLLLDLADGKKISAIAATFQHSPSVLLATQQSGIKSIQDFSGKRLMLNSKNQNLELLIMLQKFGLTDKIIRLQSSFDINDLLNNKTDGFNAYLTNEPYFLEQKLVTPIIFSPKDYQLNFYGDVIFTSQEFLEEKPELVEAFRLATIQGWMYAINHPEEIIDLIISKYGSQKSKAHLRFEANALRKMMMLDLVDVGHMNRNRWQRNVKQLQDLNLLEKNFDLDSFLYSPPKLSFVQSYLLWIVVTSIIFFTALLLLIYFIHINRRLYIEIKRRRDAEINALHKAMHDPLTLLPNRYLFQDRLEQIILQKKRQEITPLMIFMDLDNFKQINDKFGHDEGDKLLIQVGKSLVKCMRDGDTCARIAGDEFIILIEECNSTAEAKEVAERIMYALESLFELSDPTHKISASLGVLIIDRIKSTNELYKKADQLMYRAKLIKDEHFVIAKLSQL